MSSEGYEDGGPRHVMKLVVVTGVSGAGKTTAAHALEDLGFFCADNLPMPLLPRFIELLAAREEIQKAALVVDARSGEFLDDAGATLAELRRAGHQIEVMFLDAPDDVLIRRFSETRRRHPLSGTDIRSGLLAERRQIEPLRQEATTVIDTAQLTVHGLRNLVLERWGHSESRLVVSLVSFGFKHGLPVEADIVLDVRFLPNPFFIDTLSPLSGRDEPVKRFVLDNPDSQTFIEKADALLDLSIRGFGREGKSYATVAIGCTGGRHRSVAIADELARRLGERFTVTVRHRDVDRQKRPSAT